MSANQLVAKIAAPYALAFFDFSVTKNIMHKVTNDFQNLKTFFDKTTSLKLCLNNPLINRKTKEAVLLKIVKPQLSLDTFKFLVILVSRNRINLLDSIISKYLALAYDAVSIKIIEVSTALPFTNLQKSTLIKKLKKLINVYEIQLIIKVDSSLIRGFLIRTDSKVVDFTFKNQLKRLVKHLDSISEL